MHFLTVFSYKNKLNNSLRLKMGKFTLHPKNRNHLIEWNLRGVARSYSGDAWPLKGYHEPFRWIVGREPLGVVTKFKINQSIKQEIPYQHSSYPKIHFLLKISKLWWNFLNVKFLLKINENFHFLFTWQTLSLIFLLMALSIKKLWGEIFSKIGSQN